MNNNYRYQLERYRGRSTRHVCPQCGRKYTFTKYIDTYNNNIYINDRVGKCNRLDKCGYHYTPRQYFEDNPWKKDNAVALLQIIGKSNKATATPPPPPRGYIPEWVFEQSRNLPVLSDHMRWLVNNFGVDKAQYVSDLYEVGYMADGRVIFWQIDIEGGVRTGKIMAYDPATGHRRKEEGSIGWVHSELKREGILAEDWRLEQCLYGEHLLEDNPDRTVALVEAYKTAHVGAILMPNMVWLAVDSMMGLTEERLKPLKGRDVILYADEGKGFEEWERRIAPIASSVGFSYRMSRFTKEYNAEPGDDIVDVVEREELAEDECPF